MSEIREKTDTPQGLSEGGGGKSGPSPDLHERVVSGDRNAGDPANKQRRRENEMPRDKPVESEADKDVKNGG